MIDLKTGYDWCLEANMRILDLFNQAWQSDSLRDCPTFAEWAVALPSESWKIETNRLSQIDKENTEVGENALTLILKAKKAEDQGDITLALFLYKWFQSWQGNRDYFFEFFSHPAQNTPMRFYIDRSV